MDATAAQTQTTTTPVQRGWRRGEPTEHLITREWLITNALGGYASGTIVGVSSRRIHGILVTENMSTKWSVAEGGAGEFDFDDGCEKYPHLRLKLFGRNAHLDRSVRTFDHVLYRVERSRGYEHEGALWSPGAIKIDLTPEEDAGFIASVEAWDVVRTLSFDDVWEAENERRTRLLEIARKNANDDESEQLVLAADQFVIYPHARPSDEARVRAAGDEPRTVIAGYHWFTDWGRDTMIGLEGLTLVTGRHREAAFILRAFAHYVRDGLIPNLFPDGSNEGLYHTADATLWFFHALERYRRATGDEDLVVEL